MARQKPSWRLKVFVQPKGQNMASASGAGVAGCLVRLVRLGCLVP